MGKILSNQVHCHKCDDRPFSGNVHDFRPCKCGSVYVDGGMDYLRRAYNEDAEFTDISIEIGDNLYQALRSRIDEAYPKPDEDSDEPHPIATADADAVFDMIMETADYDPVDDESRKKIVAEIQRMIGSRNSLGLICAFYREYRDTGHMEDIKRYSNQKTRQNARMSAPLNVEAEIQAPLDTPLK